MTVLTIATQDHQAISATRFEPIGSPRAHVVIAAGMGIPQSFYAPFARFLASQGYVAWTFDYRGTGKSRLGTMRGVQATLSDWFLLDYDAIINAAADAAGARPLFAVGHSFGGQSAPLLPSRERLSGLVNIAVGSGALRHNQPSLRRKARLMWHIMVPLLCPLFGYFPGSRIGVVGDIPTGAMLQWRQWCLTPDYILTGEPGARDAYASVTFPVLALTFPDDELLREEGSQLLHAAYPAGNVDYRAIKAEAVGLARIGHVGFFRSAGEAALWPMVTAWFAAREAGNRGPSSD